MTDEEGPALARRLWALFESVHAVVYFHPTTLAALEAAGLRGFWRGYFAQRSAPLGPVGEAPVRASFFGFSASMTARALPAVWGLASPAEVLAARLDGTGRALAEVLPEGPHDRLADDLWALASALPCDGRVLAAANQALPRPEDPLHRLWLAATILREHRGDGHVAALVAAGLTGVESLVLRAGSDLSRPVLQAARGWTDEEWTAAAEGLAARGLLRDDRTTSDAGKRLLARVEETTDDLAWDGLARAGGTVDGVRRLAHDLRAPAVACHAVLPEVHPIGVLEIDG
ncbi:SCO6745 family protein [Umezawaea sp. Da 62-37]|uniref:SCO6745 family protein n=1 Tax=Umezawaea sp. Da 62-37 TaxID=3075927 RepID=UPI0028F71780|nr:hypothetical protein [Umezawaea sp. Da 62-37]WNV86022.1 hypothetical protein RM788_49240 [Umezawaea sp. Da 62-37]